MADRGGFAPKVRVLTQHETQATFETWKDTLIFNLEIDGTFEMFLDDDVTWEPDTVAHRGLKPDTTGEVQRTSRQKAAILNRMLGTIASYAPVISRQFITKEALSLDAIWNRLRIFYGFRKSGALILDLNSIILEEGETHECLWERTYAFFADNLLSPSDGLRHLNEDQPPKEVMSPTLLNTAVVIWLKTIHPQLPSVVKQKYTTELRNKTLATLREEISESLDSMLAELQGENASVSRTTFRGGQKKRFTNNPDYKQKQKPYVKKVCPLCEAYSRPTNHYLSQCPYLPEAEKRYMNRPKYRLIEAIEDSEEEEYEEEPEEVAISKATRAVNLRKVDVASSPYLCVQYGRNNVNMLLDSGAETSLIELEYAKSLKIPISATTTSASLADGSSSLKIVGEVHIVFTKGNLHLKFDALVAERLTDKVIAGIPFLTSHDIYARPSTKTIYIGKQEFKYDSKTSTTANIMRVSRKTVLLPGDCLQLKAPDALSNHQEIFVEPKLGAKSLQGKFGHLWLQPQIVPVSSDGHIELMNSTTEPVMVNRHEHLAFVRPVSYVEETDGSSFQLENPISKNPSTTTDFADVRNDPNEILNHQQRRMFNDLHKDLKEVFDSRTLGCYNGNSGPLEVVINMGPSLPPSRKGRLPLYNNETKIEMQKICDDLEGTVLVKPEEVGITCEYLNPSFLVKKSSGKKRLVTAFAEVGSYAKPQPALMPDTNTVLRQIGNWTYIIKTDLTSAYWQLPLKKESMKYCGVATPFKGIRVYSRGAMGMPGTETALEELLSRILGDQITEGGVTKLADDLYIGGSTPEEAFTQWKRVLVSLLKNGLRLSASKTVICPKSVSILGWTWEQGTIRASSHKISALSSVEPPSTVAKMKSYIGSMKFLSRVMKEYSNVLYPLEEAIAGRKPAEKIDWTDHLLTAFHRSQNELKNTKTLTIPRKDDQLNIITDASSTGVGAALYVVRKGKPYIAGFFNAKHKKHQESWLPCEWEALSISAAVTHFAPEIVNSSKQTTILSDSLPCVQAYGKLRRGQFSTSSRVVTFISVLSRYNVHIMHIKGANNVYSDYASRNAPDCTEKACQVCSYIDEATNSVVRSCTVQDILQSTAAVPFSSKSGWHELQVSDRSLRRTAACLQQGTKPSRKETGMKDVKRYLQVARMSKEGLVIVEKHTPRFGRTERIVVPRCYLNGLLQCLHLKLDHPSKSQLRQVFERVFYALDLEVALTTIMKTCHTCLSLSDMPNKFVQQTTTTNPKAIGSNYSADVVKRSGQSILLLREYISSYTTAKLIANEQASTLRNSLLVLSKDMISPHGQATIKVDPASCFRSLENDSILKKNGLQLELGEPKYVNKNPVAEHAVREFHSEVNRLSDNYSQITELLVSKAVGNMNSRIRGEGLSSREIWTQRDQFTNEQIPLQDMQLIKSKSDKKLQSHLPSSYYKSRGKHPENYCPIEKGSIVYINSDRTKLKPRDRYIVTDVSNDTCQVQKFTGDQLRARPYQVKRADIMKVQPWRFLNCHEEDGEQEIVRGRKPIGNLDDTGERDQFPDTEEDISEGSAEEDVLPHGNETNENFTSRSSRKVRPPSLYDTQDPNDEETNDEPECHPRENTTRFGRKTKPPDRWGTGVSHSKK